MTSGSESLLAYRLGVVQQRGSMATEPGSATSGDLTRFHANAT